MAKRRRDLGPCRCPYSLGDPAEAGFATWELLAQRAREYPHMKPCGKENWNWIYRTACNFCPEGLRNEHEGRGA